MKYISQANISTYTDIDSFIRDNITNISPATSNWTTDTTIPTINVYTYDGDGSVEYNPQTSSSSEQLYNPGTVPRTLKVGNYKSYFEAANAEYDRANPPPIFQSQRLRMEALNEIRMDVRISRNESKLEEIQEEIDMLDNTRSGN